MLLTSGQKQRPRLAQQVYRFMLDQEPLLGAASITVHHRRLTSEGVVGWQQQEDELEFLIDAAVPVEIGDVIRAEGAIDHQFRDPEPVGMLEGEEVLARPFHRGFEFGIGDDVGRRARGHLAREGGDPIAGVLRFGLGTFVW